MSIDVNAGRVFFLVQTDPGRAVEAQDFLQQRPGISEVVTTSGPFDLIVTTQVVDSEELERLVGECRSAPGLARLCQCRAARLQV